MTKQQRRIYFKGKNLSFTLLPPVKVMGGKTLIVWYHTSKYVTLRGERDFADVNEVTNQLTLQQEE